MNEPKKFWLMQLTTIPRFTCAALALHFVDESIRCVASNHALDATVARIWFVAMLISCLVGREADVA